jgi:selenocysteine lyase/cysteine desulfurase
VRSRGSTRFTTRRTSRSTCATSAATFSSARRTSSAGRTSASPTSGGELAETWRPYKARPSASTPVGRRFETGTLPYELLAGFSATIAYLHSLGGLAALRDYERALGSRLIESLPENVTLYGPQSMEGRVPTFLFNVDGVPAEQAARRLGERGLGVWYADNWYCVALGPRLPEQSLRAGLIHYNTEAEVDLLVRELAGLAA